MENNENENNLPLESCEGCRKVGPVQGAPKRLLGEKNNFGEYIDNDIYSHDTCQEKPGGGDRLVEQKPLSSERKADTKQ